MRVLDGAEVTEEEIIDLDFDADGELLVALNEAYIKLLEFVHDGDLRKTNGILDEQERPALQIALKKIVKLYDAASL